MYFLVQSIRWPAILEKKGYDISCDSDCDTSMITSQQLKVIMISFMTSSNAM